MKTPHTLNPCLTLLVAMASLAALTAFAYPPAPHHIIYGMVRDDMGNPLTLTNAEVVLATVDGIQIKAQVIPELTPGMNYRLFISMDSGLTPDSYQITALRQQMLFRLQAKIRNVTYLPLEMVGQTSRLGKPGESTRFDLTLGEDADGDGLPDAWERAVIAALGGKLVIENINPDDDLDGDGMTNLQEYLAGTFAFDPKDGFRVNIVTIKDNHPVLEFLAIRGRSYSFEASSDVKTWFPVQFRLLTDSPDSPPRDFYAAPQLHFCDIEVLPPPGVAAERLFYRAKVQ